MSLVKISLHNMILNYSTKPNCHVVFCIRRRSVWGVNAMNGIKQPGWVGD
ncbi:hypothetical protein CR351_002325 [Salmonella enterica subsp. enterica serovar Mississippi]|nr:hypothetical protein [Salmonella enterica]EDQ7393625.1 hypothetical protein [Salmonella enterica subsp. enterica serovar Mississippi]EEJ3252874.1 hypothetical protein [Salmonella enterica subsp. enterica serovar Leeuwarden]EDR0335572.1 hypothetical protein [Salmonella enterica subsp. enterica serovar Mississippi]EDR5227064.1 hypothetical protein [Salmonella enterica]